MIWNKNMWGAFLLLVIPMLACGPARPQVTPTPTKTPRIIRTVEPLSTPTVAEATTAPTQPPATMAPEATEAMALPDLGGREITIAVENAYLPFNYVRLDTGQAEDCRAVSRLIVQGGAELLLCLGEGTLRQVGLASLAVAPGPGHPPA